MSNIIDKLVIKPVELRCELTQQERDSAIDYRLVYAGDQIRELEEHRNKMLEAVINNLDLNQRGYFIKQKILKDLIEEITGLSWSEIERRLK